MPDRLMHAFIFARGGSKGLPRKNLLPIAGHPMLAHGIVAAQALPSVSRVFVSTDCSEIAGVARAYGADVIERPAELAGDTASEWHAWQHAVEYVFTQFGRFDAFLSLPPTAPCRSREDILRCIDALDPESDMVLTMTPSHRSPWFNMVTEDKNGMLRLVSPSLAPQRRQDCPPCFDLTTVAYVCHAAFVQHSKGIWDGRVRGVIVPKERAIDIDTELDYVIARFLMETYLPSKSCRDDEH